MAIYRGTTSIGTARGKGKKKAAGPGENPLPSGHDYLMSFKSGSPPPSFDPAKYSWGPKPGGGFGGM